MLEEEEAIGVEPLPVGEGDAADDSCVVPPLIISKEGLVFNGKVEKEKPLAKPRRRTLKADLAKRIPLISIIQELTDPEAGRFPDGVSPKQLLAYSESLPAEQRPNSSKNHLQVQLCRMASRGVIVRLSSGGVYTTPENISKRDTGNNGASAECHESGQDEMDSPPVLQAIKTEPQIVSNGGSPKSTSKRKSPQNGDRPKRKRTKKTMGPEFVTYAANSKYKCPVCDFCLLPGSMNLNGQPEPLLMCNDCEAKAHPSCMGYTRELALRCRRSIWQCIDCKVCVVCNEAGSPEALLFCDSCDKGHHMQCHEPAITEHPVGKWVCAACKAAAVAHHERTRQRASESTEPPSRERGCAAAAAASDVAGAVIAFGMDSAFPTCDCDATSFLPDLTQTQLIREAAVCVDGWSAAEVSRFVGSLGFDDEALALREQEIDGQALLLLKRSDVLARLSLKLGPALKLYRRIFALQSVYEEVHQADEKKTQ